MKKSRKIGIFSDIHIHNFADFAVPVGRGLNSRAKVCLDVLDKIFWEALRRKWEAILFCGDLFDTREFLLTPLIYQTVKRIAGVAKIIPVVMIRGNHDMAMDQKDSPSSVEMFSVIPGVYVLSNGRRFIGDGFTVVGFGADEFDPTLELRAEKRTGILILHDIIKGSKAENGYVFSEGIPISDVESFMETSSLNFCFVGDIHHRQRVKSKKFIKYVGNCLQKRFGEDTQKKGIHELDVDRKKVKFIPIASPRFIQCSGDEIGDLYDPDHYFEVTVNDRGKYNSLTKEYKGKTNIKLKYSSPDRRVKKEKANKTVSSDPNSNVESYVHRRVDDKPLADRLVESGKRCLK